MTYSFTYDSETVLSYAVKGGVGYEISDQATLFSELTYQNLASYESTGGVDYDSNNFVSVNAGVRFSF